jgi:NADH dehydrogenase
MVDITLPDGDTHRGRDTSPTQPRVVVLGAGFAGLEVARRLDRAPVRVTVVDRRNYHLFQPLLYQVATAMLSPTDIATPVRHVLRRQPNTEVLLAEVLGVDVERRYVLVRGPEGYDCPPVPYDILIVATGAVQSYLGHDEWKRVAPGLKSVHDATVIRRQVLLAFEQAALDPVDERRQALLTFVIVGGGPTGVEMAGALARLAHHTIPRDFRQIQAASVRIVLVEGMERILPAFPASLARKATARLRRLGVEVRTNSLVEAVDDGGILIAGERLDSRSVIWAGGVRASPVGRWLGAAVDREGRVIVQDDLTLRGHPEIFVIGDTANVDAGGRPLPALAPIAMQEGRHVAQTICNRMANLPTSSFHYHDRGNLTKIGPRYAIGEYGNLHVNGAFAWLLWLGVHILCLIGYRHRVIVLLKWLWSWFTAQSGARIITPDAPFLPARDIAAMSPFATDDAHRAPEEHPLGAATSAG